MAPEKRWRSRVQDRGSSGVASGRRLRGQSRDNVLLRDLSDTRPANTDVVRILGERHNQVLDRHNADTTVQIPNTAESHQSLACRHNCVRAFEIKSSTRSELSRRVCARFRYNW